MGASVLGGALQPHLSAGTTNPLTTTGSTLGRFIGPVAVISAGGIVFKELNKTKKKLKGARIKMVAYNAMKKTTAKAKAIKMRGKGLTASVFKKKKGYGVSVTR